jgi:hypothetical protein
MKLIINIKRFILNLFNYSNNTQIDYYPHTDPASNYKTTKAIKYNFDEYSFQIDIYAIKHILKEHGNESKEDTRGQIAVKDEDILLVFDVLQFPDLILNSGKNKLGKETITFIKQVDNRYVIIQEVRTGLKTVALNSMRIFKTKRTN